MALNRYFPDIATDVNIQINNNSDWEDFMVSFREYREPDMAETIAQYACHSKAEQIHILVGRQHSKGLLELLESGPLKNPIHTPIDLEKLDPKLLNKIPSAEEKFRKIEN